MNFLPIEFCKKIQEKTNIKSLFVYNKEQIINPEIIEKHGDLTDDGYYELTKECGGPYKFNEVYIYDYKLMLKRDVWVEKEMVYAYTIDCVLKWLREEKDIHIKSDISFRYTSEHKKDKNGTYSGFMNVSKPFWSFLIRKIKNGNCIYDNTTASNNEYSSYEDACISGIEYLMSNNLI